MAVQKDPKSAYYRVSLGDAYRWSDQRSKSTATYNETIGLAYEALRVNPSDAQAMADLANASAKNGDAANASKFIRQARQIQPANNSFMYIEATIYTLAGKFNEALASLREAIVSGYSLAEAKTDPELKPLRDRSEFAQLEKELGSQGAKSH